MPSCELPANLITASEILETFEPPEGAVRVDAASLIKSPAFILRKKHQISEKPLVLIQMHVKWSVSLTIWGVKPRFEYFCRATLTRKSFTLSRLKVPALRQYLER